MGRRINIKDIQDLTEVSHHTVKKRLYAASVAPLGESGTSIVYDSLPALKAVLLPQSAASESDQEDKKALLVAEQYREKKRENDLAEGLVGPFDLITEAISKAGAVVMANLDALPGEMKRSNPELTAADLLTVKKAIAKCCLAISEMRVVEEDV